MGALSIPNFPDDVHDRRRALADRAGVSVEVVVQQILEEASNEPERKLAPNEVKAWVQSLYQGNLPKNAVDELLRERRALAKQEFNA
jgi:plasmid stability protein